MFDGDGGDGNLDFAEFKRFSQAKNVADAIRLIKENMKSKGRFTEAELYHMLERIHTTLNDMAAGQEGKPDFKKVFNDMDRDGGGLSIKELEDGLASMGFELDKTQVEQIGKVFDGDGTHYCLCYGS